MGFDLYVCMRHCEIVVVQVRAQSSLSPVYCACCGRMAAAHHMATCRDGSLDFADCRRHNSGWCGYRCGCCRSTLALLGLSLSLDRSTPICSAAASVGIARYGGRLWVSCLADEQRLGVGAADRLLKAIRRECLEQEAQAGRRGGPDR